MTYKSGEIMAVLEEEQNNSKLEPFQDSILNSWKQVWQFRTKFEKYWPTPSRKQSLHFALQEIGEADDAWIRGTTDNFARNMERSMNLRKELSQATIMLLTAIENDFSIYAIEDEEMQDMEETIVRSAIWIADALCAYHDDSEDGDWLYSLERALSVLFSVLTPDDIKTTLDEVYQNVIYNKLPSTWTY